MIVTCGHRQLFMFNKLLESEEAEESKTGLLLLSNKTKSKS